MSDDDAVEIDIDDAGDDTESDDVATEKPEADSESEITTESPSEVDADDEPGTEAGAGSEDRAGFDVDAGSDGERSTTDEPIDDDVTGDDTSLSEQVSEYDEDLAEDIAELETTASELESTVEELEADLEEKDSEVDDLTDRLKRTQADFQNYKKRAKKRQEQLKERATEDLVERVVTVRDNLIRALDQDEEADIRPGIESTLEEFDRILAEENVDPIEPSPGEDVDPTRHQVMMRVESDQPAGTIADVYQPGYEMDDKVIREAQVTVSDDAGN